MKIFKNTNLIPIIIIIFCFLIFFGIIHNKKVEKINNIMESFMNNDKNIENFNNKEKNSIITASNTNFSVEYINGNWTTPNTKLDSKNNVIPSTLMTIKLNENKTGEIYLPKINGNNFYTGITYKVNISSIGLNIIAKSDKSQYTLSINFINRSTNKNFRDNELILSSNIPVANIEFLDNNNNVKNSLLSYKITDNVEIDGKLKTIILSRNYINRSIKDIYDINSYLTIIRDYKFKENTINFSGIIYSRDPNTVNVYNNIKNKYNNILSFSIAREFYTPKGTTIKTFSSKIYNLKIDNSLPEFINVNSIKDDDNNINYIKYKPKSTIIYFYKITSTSSSYSFRKQNKIIPNKFNFMNNGKNMLKGSIYDIDDLNSLEKNMKSNYSMTVFKTIFTPDEKLKIKFQFKELYNFI
jgi:hypothetical protein